ncbi:hypothetical protein KIN20_014484 [Parelaphostrongylus tenuis]|uniref:ShKT domain-containing protein n=1 Tax=Parelaphostrongylus tenuis TaxID=148309 RepID=A0AAD5MW55_PARTN|nr:hypothetical protein KIN20_014484 [Parelaphostrongylus tenuis]
MAAAPADLSCTAVDGADSKYTEGAVNCKDKLSSATCLVLYTEAVAVATSKDRNAKCYQGADQKLNEEVVQAAVQICPKTCGYCCKTSAFNCKNKEATNYCRPSEICCSIIRSRFRCLFQQVISDNERHDSIMMFEGRAVCLSSKLFLSLTDELIP